MAYAGGGEMSRRGREPVPRLPRRVLVRVRGRVVAEIAFGDDPGLIIPGSVLWHCDPAGVSGPDRERAAAYVVAVAKLDPKVDTDRIWESLWGQAPKRE